MLFAYKIVIIPTSLYSQHYISCFSCWQARIDLKTLKKFTHVIFMCGGNDACDHSHKDIPAKRAGKITRKMKFFTDSIPKRKIMVASVLPRELWDTEVGVLNKLMKKFRKNFVQLHVHPEYKS